MIKLSPLLCLALSAFGQVSVSSGGSSINQPYLDASVGADKTGATNSLAAMTAVFAGAAGRTIWIPKGTYLLGDGNTGRVVAGISIPAGATVQCEPGAVILKNHSGNLFTATANNTTITGCTMDGQQSLGFTGSLLEITGVTGFNWSGNTLKNANTYATSISNSSDGKVFNNAFTGSLQYAIYAVGPALSNIEAAFNEISQTSTVSVSTIMFHGASNGSTVSGLNIHDNQIAYSVSGGFCIEVGGFPPLTSDTATVTNNKISKNSCMVSANSTSGSGGISIDGATQSEVTGNLYDTQGFGGASGNYACVELVKSHRNVVSGNRCILRSKAIYGIDLDTSSNNTVQTNYIDSPQGFGANAAAGIWIQAGAVDLKQAVGNNITGNAIRLGAVAGGQTARDIGIKVSSNGDAGAIVALFTRLMETGDVYTLRLRDEDGKPRRLKFIFDPQMNGRITSKGGVV